MQLTIFQFLRIKIKSKYLVQIIIDMAITNAMNRIPKQVELYVNANDRYVVKHCTICDTELINSKCKCECECDDEDRKYYGCQCVDNSKYSPIILKSDYPIDNKVKISVICKPNNDKYKPNYWFEILYKSLNAHFIENRDEQHNDGDYIIGHDEYVSYMLKKIQTYWRRHHLTNTIISKHNGNLQEYKISYEKAFNKKLLIK